jgi:hypothetical protein
VRPPKKDRKIVTLRDTFNDRAKLFDFLKKNSSHEKREEALMNFAQRTDVLSLHRFLEQCQWEGFAAPLVAYSVVHNLVSGGSDDMVSSLLVTANKASPLYGIFNVGQSFVDCKNFEIRSCGHHLREGVYYCLKNGANFPDLGFLMQNAYLMESVEWPSPERYPMPADDFEIVRRDTFENSPSYMLSTWGSPLYFKRFWDKRIKNIREIFGEINILLTLVNPDTDSISKVKSCGGVTVAVVNCPETTTEHLGLAIVVAFRKLLEICNHPMIGFELDSTYPPEAKDVFDVMAKYPITITETDSLYPALRIDGAGSATMPCDEADAFSDMIFDHYREDLARGGPIYLFDQIAKYRAVAEGRRRGWNMFDVNKYTNGGFRRIFKQGGSELSIDKRKKTRSSMEYVLAGMTEDRRIIVKKITQTPAELQKEKGMSFNSRQVKV